LAWFDLLAGAYLLAGFDAEETVYLVLVHRPVAGRCRHHEITHQLDLGLQVTVCKAVLGFRHVNDATRQRAC
jgi:hypothetical protein